LNGLTKGLTDLLRSRTKRNLRPTTTDSGLQQNGGEGTSAIHLLINNYSMALETKSTLFKALLLFLIKHLGGKETKGRQ
jgi:hypothetical protein